MQVLKISELENKVQLTKSSVYRLIARGEFPAPIHLMNRSVGWIDTEVNEWILSRRHGVRVGVIKNK